MWMIGLTQTWRENEAQPCFRVNLIKSLFSLHLYQHLPAIKCPQQRSFKREVFIEHVEETVEVMAKKKKEKQRGDTTSLDEQSSEGSKKRSVPAVSAQIVSISTMCKWKGGMRAFLKFHCRGERCGGIRNGVSSPEFELQLLVQFLNVLQK